MNQLETALYNYIQVITHKQKYKPEDKFFGHRLPFTEKQLLDFISLYNLENLFIDKTPSLADGIYLVLEENKTYSVYLQERGAICEYHKFNILSEAIQKKINLIICGSATAFIDNIGYFIYEFFHLWNKETMKRYSNRELWFSLDDLVKEIHKSKVESRFIDEPITNELDICKKAYLLEAKALFQTKYEVFYLKGEKIAELTKENINNFISLDKAIKYKLALSLRELNSKFQDQDKEITFSNIYKPFVITSQRD